MFKTFEVFNSENKRVFYTENRKCVPSNKQLGLMQRAGYKFKLDGKAISKKKLDEIVFG